MKKIAQAALSIQRKTAMVDAEKTTKVSSRTKSKAPKGHGEDDPIPAIEADLEFVVQLGHGDTLGELPPQGKGDRQRPQRISIASP